MAALLGRTVAELEASIEHAELVEWMAYEALDGPQGVHRVEAYQAARMAQAHNQNLSKKDAHHARKPSDYLMFREKHTDIGSELSKAGIQVRRGK